MNTPRWSAMISGTFLFFSLRILVMLLPVLLATFTTERAQALLRTPTKEVPVNNHPIFQDDMNFKNLELALNRQIARFEQRSMSGRIQYGQDIYPEVRLLETLREFAKDLKVYRDCKKLDSFLQPSHHTCLGSFRNTIARKYKVYAPDLEPGDPRYGESKDTFFTAYYTPTLVGDYVKSSRYPHGAYRRPTNESLAQSLRDDIDFRQKLENKGYDIFYTDDLFELYLLQVQGGGKVIVNQGSPEEESFYISYDGTNRQTWRWISKYMQQKGYIDNLSIDAQREFLKNHPEKQREIYRYCPSYVYFKPTAHPPEGSDSVSLTNGRSIATDSGLYVRKGALAFVQAMKPDPNREGNHFISFSRFMLDQDTGGAIKGKGRVDLFHGEGAYAERAAFSTQHTGNLYFLVLK